MTTEYIVGTVVFLGCLLYIQHLKVREKAEQIELLEQAIHEADKRLGLVAKMKPQPYVSSHIRPSTDAIIYETLKSACQSEKSKVEKLVKDYERRERHETV